MSTEQTKVLPVSVHLSGEIISMIAEACIEPFLIKVDRRVRATVINSRVRSTLPPSLLGFRLAVVSRDFKSGIERGLRNNFSGHLTLPGGYIHYATEALSNRGLWWVISKTKQLHLRLSAQHLVDREVRPSYLRYVNAKDVRIACRWQHSYASESEIHLLEVESVQDMIERAEYVLETLGAPVRNNSVSIMKLIFPVGPSEKRVSSYIYTEVQFSGSAPKVLMRYKSDTLDWDIRSSPEKEE